MKAQIGRTEEIAHFAGAAEVVSLTAHPWMIDFLIGIAGAAVSKAPELLAEFVAEDFYEWFKGRFVQPLFGRAARDQESKTTEQGVKIVVRKTEPGTDAPIFNINFRPAMGNKTMQAATRNDFRPLENIVQPAFAYAAAQAKLCASRRIA